MPRKGDIKFMPATTPGVTGNRLYTLDQIPEDVKKEVEEVYQALKTNPGGRMRVEYDNKGEVATFANQVISYCKLRPAELGGPIRFRKSPTRALPDNMMDYRITDLLVGESADTDMSTTDATTVEALSYDTPEETATNETRRGRK